MKPPVEVIPSQYFVKRVKKLKKSYPKVQDDLQPFIEKLIDGETPGDQVQAVGATVYKARIPNRDAKRGKSGGYRVVYYIQTSDSVVLLTIYSKSERTDISIEEIQQIIDSLPPETTNE